MYKAQNIKHPVNLFNSRSNYTQLNFGNDTDYAITIVSCCDQFNNTFGQLSFYSQLLCDFIKHNFIITSITGVKEKLAAPINPYKDTFIFYPKTNVTELEVTLDAPAFYP